MSTIKSIPIEQFCIHYEIPTSFINSLVEFELIDTVVINKKEHLPEHLISKVERLIRLHYDLNINVEGLDVITNLMSQISELNDELYELRNKLDFYKNSV